METPVRFKFKNVPDRYNYRSGTSGMVKMKPGDIITCLPSRLGSHIKLFERLDPMPPPTPPMYVLKAVPCAGGFNVINGASGQPINTVPLSEKDARAMTEHNFNYDKPEAKNA